MIRMVVLGMLLIPRPALPETGTLAAGDGQDTVAATCGTCHSLDYIRMNAPFLTPDVWQAEVTKMRVAFGAPIDDDVAAEVQRYLNAHYGTKP